MAVATQNKYTEVLRRQEKLEREFNMLKKAVLETDETNINPATLKRWERISKDLDNGKGRQFSSLRDMKKWLARL